MNIPYFVERAAKEALPVSIGHRAACAELYNKAIRSRLIASEELDSSINKWFATLKLNKCCDEEKKTALELVEAHIFVCEIRKLLMGASDEVSPTHWDVD